MAKRKPVIKGWLVSLLIAGILLSFSNTAISQENGPVGSIEIIEGLYLKGRAPLISPLLFRIIECESNWRFNALNRKSGAYGICQITPSTKKYLERKWKMKINLKNPEYQLYTCWRLFEEEGYKHWRASKACWMRFK